MAEAVDFPLRIFVGVGGAGAERGVDADFAKDARV